MSDFQTTSPDQLPVLAAIPPDWHAVGASPGGPLGRLPFDRLLAKMIAADLVKPTLALLQADLAHPENSVALVHSDPVPLQNGWWRKGGASGAGAWTQFETTALAQREWIEEQIALAQGAAALVAPDANSNVRLGGSGNGSISGSNNILIGPDAGDDVTTGGSNVVAGVRAASKITSSNFVVAIGHQAAESLTSITSSVIIGGLACDNGAGSLVDSTIIGASAALVFSGEGMTAVGRGTFANATGNRNTGVGTQAGSLTTTGFNQTILGYASQGGATNFNTISLGYNVTTTASNQIRLGNTDNDHMFLFARPFAKKQESSPERNWWLLTHGPAVGPTGWGNLGIGENALNSLTNGYLNIAIGSYALEGAANSNINTIAIGAYAGQHAGDAPLQDSVLVGVSAGQYGAKGAGFTAVGFRSQQHNAGGLNNTTLGDSAFWLTQQSYSVGIGYIAGEFCRDTANATIIGAGAGTYRLNAERCVFVGTSAGAIISNQPNTNFDNGDFLTEKAANGLGAAIIAAGGAPAGVDNVGIGYAALLECLGSRVVAVGTNAGRSLVASANQQLECVHIGFQAGFNASQKADAFNQIVIGSQAWGDRNHQVVLGNSSIVETVLRGVTRHTSYTVAALPSPAAMGAGARAFVTNATSTTFASIVAGGGSNAVPVYSDGTNWRIG